MNIFKMVESSAKRMKWYDFSLLKATVFFFTVFLVTAFAGFRNFLLGFEWYWYLLIAVVLSAFLVKKMFFR